MTAQLYLLWGLLTNGTMHKASIIQHWKHGCRQAAQDHPPYAHTAVAEVSETTYPATENIGYCPLSHHPVNEETDGRGGRQDNAVGFGVNTLIGILALHVALHRYVQDYMRM